MALKSNSKSGDKNAEIAELLDTVDALIDRVKVMYEQYFMGILKTAPAQLHTDIERKIRELTQLNIRNTALRYRLVNITQKFGSYNTYWRRILRQIEHGTYVRDVARVSRQAIRQGEDIPEEILAAMPKRMRDRILRDRELVAKRAEREHGGAEDVEAPDSSAGNVAVQKPRSNVHTLDAGLLDDDLDIDALFSALTSEAEKVVERPKPALPPRPAAPPPAAARPATVPPQPSAPPPRPAAPPPAAARPATVPPQPSAPPPPKPAAPPQAAAAPKPAAPPPRPAAPPPRPATVPPAAAPPPKPAGRRPQHLPPGFTEDKARDLYDRYVRARRNVGDMSDVSYDRLMQSLSRQAPKIMEQHKAKGVDFDVVVKDDKVMLKAKPKV